VTTTRPAYPPQGEWTLAAFDALDDDVKRELVDGALVDMPPATRIHQLIAAQLAIALQAACPPRYGVTLDNEIQLGPRHVRRPDFLIITAAAADRDTYRYQPNEVLLVVEVVSPGSEKMDREIKPKVYAAAGIPLYWRIERKPTMVFTYALDPIRMAYWPTGHFGPDDVIKVDRPWEIELPVSEITPPR
jgi:Uma2 family endonuclease